MANEPKPQPATFSDVLAQAHRIAQSGDSEKRESRAEKPRHSFKCRLVRDRRDENPGIKTGRGDEESLRDLIGRERHEELLAACHDLATAFSRLEFLVGRDDMMAEQEKCCFFTFLVQVGQKPSAGALPRHFLSESEYYVSFDAGAPLAIRDPLWRPEWQGRAPAAADKPGRA